MASSFSKTTAAPAHQLIARAIIVRGDCVLANATQNAQGQAYCALPGGHVDPGEDCKTALAREIAEELKGQIEIGTLALVSECKYLGGRRGDKLRHEIVLFFHATLPHDLPMNGAQILSPEARKNFIWLPLSEMESHNLVPPALRALLLGKEAALYDFRDVA